ncbi:hypothetical protein KSP40_PGU013294 [Platanthera guangdongensis]|uniref:Uncharacterized protein n=1 Tax=Platanthera guangdongensis TaxID=2320717 RepID=A0ABR2LF27_9ASPA
MGREERIPRIENLGGGRRSKSFYFAVFQSTTFVYPPSDGICPKRPAKKPRQTKPSSFISRIFHLLKAQSCPRLFLENSNGGLPLGEAKFFAAIMRIKNNKDVSLLLEDMPMVMAVSWCSGDNKGFPARAEKRKALEFYMEFELKFDVLEIGILIVAAGQCQRYREMVVVRIERASRSRSNTTTMEVEHAEVGAFVMAKTFSSATTLCEVVAFAGHFLQDK